MVNMGRNMGVVVFAKGGGSLIVKSLFGIRVISFTRILARPFRNQTLKNLGAEVIEIERPLIGDEFRRFGAFIVKARKLSRYLSIGNAGKRLFALEFTLAKGNKALKNLIRFYDVLVGNVYLFFLERFDYSPDHIIAINPNIVYASTRGFGFTGPDRQKLAFNMIIRVASGVMPINRFDHDHVCDGRSTIS